MAGLGKIYSINPKREDCTDLNTTFFDQYQKSSNVFESLWMRSFISNELVPMGTSLSGREAWCIEY